ncbi:MAG: cobalamin biosynthesis protein [Lachnospiraceae bacterium]|nr:cobalamin biosynthesis protein [Lachnospiraceae bacterium]
MRRLMILTFTDKGYELANRICDASKAGKLMSDSQATVPAEISAVRVESGRLNEITKNAWNGGYDMLFISAVGIAVRAIAGYLDSKLSDRAVLAMDEGGRFVIPVLSGHVGGADALAKAIADYTGGEVIITSASNARDKSAFDEWAAQNNFAILNKDRIATVYDKVLSDEPVKVLCADYDDELPFKKFERINTSDAALCAEHQGELSETKVKDADVIICEKYDNGVINALKDKYADRTLIMIRRNLIIGVGCKRGKTSNEIVSFIKDTCDKAGLDIRLIGKLATIDVKADEEGIKAACANNRWMLETYTAEELKEVVGEFDSSEFVEKTVGVDNVCERAAVRAGGKLIVNKSTYEGVTVAIAVRDFS